MGSVTPLHTSARSQINRKDVKMALHHQLLLTTVESRKLRSWGGVWREVKNHYARSLFFLIFLLPTALSVVHYGILSSDRYISETKFIVRGISGNQVGGLTMILKTFGLASADDDANAINTFIKSRDALRALMKTVEVREIFQRPEGDFITSYGELFRSPTFEGLFDYFQNQISINRDIESGMNKIGRAHV